MNKYQKISNYNISYEIFNDAIREFKGYISGLSRNDLVLFSQDSTVSDVIEYVASAAELDDNEEEMEKFVSDIAPRFFDRSTGSYLFQDYSSAAGIAGRMDSINQPQKFLRILGKKQTAQKMVDGLSKCIIKTNKTNDIDDKPVAYGVNDALPYFNSKVAAQKQANELASNSPEESAGVASASQSISTDDDNVSSESDGINSEINSDRLRAPGLIAKVVRVPQVGVLARQQSHLPIFLSAIPTIEMSRCTPYLDVQIISTRFESEERLASNTTFLRFTQDSYGNLVTDGINSNATKPVGYGDEIGNNFSQMDIFNAPQTMANANINSGDFVRGFQKFNNAAFDGIDFRDPGTYIDALDVLNIGNTDNLVYEPIAPLATLKSFNLSITSAGSALFASKQGVLSMVLHDRSRLSELAPLVATNRFATTKIRIEYGWSHPDGGAFSNNAIGQYLDGLRDISTYQVLGTDYSFGDGGVVDLKLKLVAYGVKETKRVHCGAGRYVPLTSISNLIEEATSKAIQAADGKEDISEVRQEIKLNSRNARSSTSVLEWEQVKVLNQVLKNHPEQLKNITAKILTPGESIDIQGTFGNEGVSIEIQEAINALASIVDDNNKEDLLASVGGKIKALQNDTNDPFIYELHKDTDYIKAGIFSEVQPDDEGFITEGALESQSVTIGQRMKDLKALSKLTDKGEKVITLGKLLLNFVGWPLSASCLYDEIQMIFYPLNHQAGAARIHTTASLPISLNKVERVVTKYLEKNQNLSVNGFFQLINREILRDRSLPVYGFYNLENNTTIENLKNNKTEEEKIKAVVGLIKQNTISTGTGDVATQLNSLIAGADPEKTDELISGMPTPVKAAAVRLYNDYLEDLSSTLSSAITKECQRLYGPNGDGLHKSTAAEPKFVRPNFSLLFESVPAASPQEQGDAGYFQNLYAASGIKDSVDSLKESIGIDPSKTSGLQNKTILKIHVYDEEAVSSPTEATLLSSYVNSTTNVPGLPEKFKKLSFYEAKEFVKRSYPTIIYGATTSTVKSLSVSANTSGELANVLMIEGYSDLKKGQVDAHQYDNKFEEIQVFPNTITIELMGMPNITRGTSLFVDFGTNTSLDNIYTVKSVDHVISSGRFQTSLTVVPSAMGAISSFRDRIASRLS